MMDSKSENVSDNTTTNNNNQRLADNHDDIPFQSIVDVHCHIVESPLSLHLIPSLKVKQVWIMGTRLDDWDETLQCQNSWPSKVVASLGENGC
jgi:hypothetical protein